MKGDVSLEEAEDLREARNVIRTVLASGAFVFLIALLLIWNPVAKVAATVLQAEEERF